MVQGSEAVVVGSDCTAETTPERTNGYTAMRPYGGAIEPGGSVVTSVHRLAVGGRVGEPVLPYGLFGRGFSAELQSRLDSRYTCGKVA